MTAQFATDPSKALSIVLPCFNEAGNIAGVVKNALAAGPSVTDDLEVLVVDDGSTDNTQAEALRSGDPRVRVLRHEANQGYGAALRSGFREARMPFVFYTDGDGQFDLSQLPRVFEAWRKDSIVIGYRSPRADGSPLRTFNGRGWTWLTNLTLGLKVRDVNCAFKLFPRSFLDRVSMESRGATIDAEILFAARRQRLNIVEVPIEHQPRTRGQATGARPAVIARAVLELAQLRMRAESPMRAPAE